MSLFTLSLQALHQGICSSVFKRIVTSSRKSKLLSAVGSGGNTYFRNVRHSVCLCRFYDSHPTAGENHSDVKKKRRENLLGLKDELRNLRHEVVKWKERVGDDNHLWRLPGDRHNLWSFNSKTVLKSWRRIRNSDHNEAFNRRFDFGLSRTGKGLFPGFVNTRPPSDGAVTVRYCFIRSERQIEDNDGVESRREKIHKANRKIKEKGQTILKDLKDTKQQMQEKMGEMMTRENVWTVPNALSVMRMGMAPVAAYMILNSQFGPAIGVFAIAGVTDLLDGWIARVVPGQSSVMGSFLDPMADKILVGTLFISLTYMDLIPVPLTALIIGRDAILIAAGFYIRYQSLEPPRTLSRYFNVTHPTAQLAPTFISKINTGIQLGLVGATLVSTIIPYDTLSFLQLLWYCTAASTVASAVSYVFAKDTVKLLRKKPSVTNVDKIQKKNPS